MRLNGMDGTELVFSFLLFFSESALTGNSLCFQRHRVLPNITVIPVFFEWIVVMGL